MTLSITLDWISVTFKGITRDAKLWLDTFASAETGETIKPLYGYKSGVRAQSGVCIFWNIDREEMGRHYEFGGTALRCLWGDYGLDQKETLQKLCDFGGRFTRLDLAKDLAQTSIDFDGIYQALNARAYTGTAREPSQRKSPGGGNTVYIGSWKSDKFMRLYNKAAESKLKGEDWARFEIVMKSDYARALAWNLTHNDDWNGVFDGIALPTCTMTGDNDYGKFFPDGVVPIGLPKIERLSDREKWIDQQVTPAIVDYYATHRESQAIAKLRALLDELDKIRENSDSDWREFHDNIAKS